MSAFDFDAWRELAARDPGEYFRRRQRILDDFMCARPESAEMLREYQRQIDQVRALAGSPTLAARQLSGMLEEHFEALSQCLQQLGCQAESLQLAAQRLRQVRS